MELTWFWPILNEKTSPKLNSKNASRYLFTNMGIRVLLKTFPPQQLKIVSHARLLLSMINSSNTDFFAFRSSKNWRNRLPGLLIRGWPHIESLTELTSDVRQGIEGSRRNFLWKRRKGSEYMLTKFNEFVFHNCFPDFSWFFSCTFRKWTGLFEQFLRSAEGRVPRVPHWQAFLWKVSEVWLSNPLAGT